jgi:hypothetical protein
MSTTEKTPAEFEAAIAAYCAALNATAEKSNTAHYTKTFAPDSPTGKVYVRIVAHTPGPSRSAHSFVERATGLIFKPAGWKGPTKNFPRGSIYDLANAPTTRVNGL